MAESGERGRGPGGPDTSRGATSLAGLGIPATRAMQLADAAMRLASQAISAKLREAKANSVPLKQA